MKYKNRKTQAFGMTFDSRKEATRYGELRMMEKAGLIHHLERQKKYVLIPSQKLPVPIRRLGRNYYTERCINYVADFVYVKNGRVIVEDTKGYATPEYKIKRKLMLYIHGIQVMEL